MSTSVHAPMAIGQKIPYTTPDGRVTITVQRITADVWTVTTYQGTLRVEDNCGSYPTEGEARLIAHGYAVMYRAEHPAEQPNTLADLAAHGIHRQVRPTMAGAHLTPLTGAQQRAIDTHADGIVYVGEGVTAATLRALARKGFGTLRYAGRRHQVASLALNGRGLAAVTAVTR